MTKARRSSRVLFLTFLIALALGCGGSAGKQPPSPSAIRAIISTAQQSTGMPGLAAAVITSHGISTSVVGVRKLGDSTLIASNDLLHLGSCMKSMTAMLAAKQVETGKLRWDSKLPEIFPELASTMRPEYRNVTLEHLLSHRGGILQILTQGDLLQLPQFTGTPSEQRVQFVSWVLQQPPVGVPGQDFNYSNGGYTIVGTTIERVTGQAYEDLMQKFLFQPLGLKAKFDWPGKDDVNQPWGHVPINGVLVPNDPNAPENQFPKFLDPAGNISLSVMDHARYVQLHLRALRGNPNLLKVATFQKLHAPAAQITDSLAYAFGWVAEKDASGNLLTWHDGSAGTFYAYMYIDPKKDKAVVVITNTGDDNSATVVADTAVKLLALVQ